jgi:MSHA biogenesis protein MshJ
MTAKLAAWWRARTRRERVLGAVAAFALVAAAVELAALAPQRAEKARLQRDILASRMQLDRMRGTAAELGAQHAPAAAREALAARRARAQAAIERTQAGLVAPQDMALQLQAILARHPQLRVTGMQSAPPKSIEAAAGAAPTLYEHGLRIDVEGRYLDLLAYLEALERAPHRIYWRSLDMKADTGVPVTRIELFTLAKEPVWLRL